MSKLDNEVYESFSRYAGTVVANRAVIDVRDCLKPSARMLLYSELVETKALPNKNYKKSARVVGDALGHFYTHGDGACYANYMRMGKPFAMRYPLQDCQGNSGTIIEAGDEAASRYTEMRLSHLGHGMFDSIKKNTIEEWENNFDDTEVYPRVLPSRGFYNIVNGTQGIAVGLAASIPQFNLVEVNEALIKLLENPDVDFEDIYCPPDFATGAVILNGDEVKESIKNGSGAAIKMRSIVDYDEKENAFIVKELPYGVYTNTISNQIQRLLEDDPTCGIDNINDGSGKTPDYVIYLKKKANPTKVLKLLYKNTSLQDFFSVNMNMLENGRKPKTFGWKEALEAYLTHQKIVYRKGFEFDLLKIKKRLHILDGLLKAIANIDEVIKTIKASANTTAANKALQQLLSIDEEQATAILNIKLSRLAHMEVTKLEKEQIDLQNEADRIEAILQDQKLLNKEIEKDLREVAKKYGDTRRTQILNIEKEQEEVKEVKDLMLTITNENNFVLETVSALYSNGRRSKGEKVKVGKKEIIIDSAVGNNRNDFILFSNKGKVYRSNFATQETKTLVSFENIFTMEPGERIEKAISAKKDRSFVVFITKNGYIKKTKLSEFERCRKSGVVGIKLEPKDYIVGVELINDEPIMMITNDGYLAGRETKQISATGRQSKGCKAMKLNGNYIVRTYRVHKEDTEVVTLSKKGKITRTKLSDFDISVNPLKGKKAQALDKGDMIIGFVLRKPNQNEVIIAYTRSQNKIKMSELTPTNRGSKGVLVAKANPTYIF